MGSAATKKNVAPAKGLDARVTKLAGVSFDAIQCALSNAIQEKYPAEDGGDCGCYPKGPWIRDVFDDVCIYSYDGKLYRVAYTFSGNTATLAGEPEEVQVTYAPVGSGAPAPASPADVQANTEKGRNAIAKRFDETMARLHSRR